MPCYFLPLHKEQDRKEGFHQGTQIFKSPSVQIQHSVRSARLLQEIFRPQVDIVTRLVPEQLSSVGLAHMVSEIVVDGTAEEDMSKS